ncbi:MAG: hypothetical protein RIC55_18170 [Pirellulaceae bacterium]
MLPPREAVRTVIAATLVVAGLLLVDFFVPTLFTWGESFGAFLAIGFCIGQLNLVATWAALARGNPALRLPWAFLLTILLWYSLVVGNRVHNRYFSLGEAIFLGALLVSGCLVAQIPLWIASRVAGVRLLPPSVGVGGAGPAEGQFRLWHLLLAMVLLSLAIAPLKAVLPPGDSLWPDNLPIARAALILSALAVCNLLITVPCIWGAFLPRRLLIPVGLGWTVYCGILTAVEIGMLSLLIRMPQSIGEMFPDFYTINFSQCMVVFGVLLIFRAIGFTLLRVQRVPIGDAT